MGVLVENPGNIVPRCFNLPLAKVFQSNDVLRVEKQPPYAAPPNPNQTKKTDQNLFSCVVNLVEPSFALNLGCKRAEATRALELRSIWFVH